MTKFVVGKKYIRGRSKSSAIYECIAFTPGGLPVLSYGPGEHVKTIRGGFERLYTEYTEPKKLYTFVYELRKDGPRHSVTATTADEAERRRKSMEVCKYTVIAYTETEYRDGDGLDEEH